MASALRIVFMGSDAIALPLLTWLQGEGRPLAEIVCVYTQPDREVGRGQKVQPNAIKTWALAQGLPVRQPEKLTEEERLELAALAPDLSLVFAYGHILRDAFIAVPRLGTVNLHASILPDYRGASPIQTAVAYGEAQTGVSFMRIVRALDAGPVADVERVTIGPRDTALDVEHALSTGCIPLMQRVLPRLQSGEIAFIEQDHRKATFCRRLGKEDGAIDFSQPAKALAARINGLFPWPAVTVQVGDVPVKLGLAEVGAGDLPDQPGTVLGSDGDALLVATGSGTLRLLQLQRPGGRMLRAAEFLRGFPIASGLVLPSTPMPELRGAVPFH